MENFSLLVQKKYDELNLSEKKIFDDEFLRRKNKASAEKVDDSDLALEILRDLALTVGSPKSQLSVKPSNTFVNARYSAPQRKSKGNYLWLIILLFLTLVSFAAFFTRPDWLKMENKTADKMLENNPEMVVLFKNMFLGKEMKKEQAEGLIKNLLINEGFSNIEIRDYDWFVMRKMEVLDSDNSKSLISACGLFGQTLVTLNFRDEKYIADVESDNKKLEEENIDKKAFKEAGNLTTKPLYVPKVGVLETNPSISKKEKIKVDERSNKDGSSQKGSDSKGNENEDNNIGDSIKID